MFWICLWLYCFTSITMIDTTAKDYLINTQIEYCLWWVGPDCYDCWGIVSQALKQEWYRWKKISSYNFPQHCVIPPKSAKEWDVLINTNTWQRHVALITSTYNYKTNDLWILDYVLKYNEAKYRQHSIYKNVYILSKSCLFYRNWNEYREPTPYKNQWVIPYRLWE